jgi:hypothetical protein
VASSLAGQGHDVSVPDLTGSIAAGPPYFAFQIRAVAGSAGDQPVILRERIRVDVDGHEGAWLNRQLMLAAG